MAKRETVRGNRGAPAPDRNPSRDRSLRTLPGGSPTHTKTRRAPSETTTPLDANPQRPPPDARRDAATLGSRQGRGPDRPAAGPWWRPKGRTAGRKTGGNKYHAKPQILDGYRFDSAKEARRYGELRLYLKGGLIADLAVHPRFDLFAINLASGEVVQIGHMTLDFQYRDLSDGGATVHEDVKGGRTTKTEAYRLRKRILEATYGIHIREI